MPTRAETKWRYAPARTLGNRRWKIETLSLRDCLATKSSACLDASRMKSLAPVPGRPMHGGQSSRCQSSTGTHASATLIVVAGERATERLDVVPRCKREMTTAARRRCSRWGADLRPRESARSRHEWVYEATTLRKTATTIGDFPTPVRVTRAASHRSGSLSHRNSSTTSFRSRRF